MLRSSLLALAAVLLLPAVAPAADRYASPDGPTTAGSPCTESEPCAIGLAARDASPGDTIRFTPGDYGTATSPLGYGIFSAAGGVAYVGHPRARMFIDNATDDSVLLADGQSWSGEGMSIVTFDPGGFHARGDVTIERLRVESRATGTGAIACNLEGDATATPQAKIYNSVCVAQGGGPNGRGLSAQVRTNGQEFRAVSVTAVAAGLGSTAVWMGSTAPATGSPFATLRLDLVLAVSSGAGSNDIRSSADGLDQRACVQTYETRAESAKISTGFCSLDETNPTRELPTFVDASADYHQRPGSAGIDPLAAPPVVPPLPTDLDGLPRDATNPDPGAYEYREAIVTTLAPADLTPTTATLRGAFRGRHGTSIVRFAYGPAGGFGSATPARFVAATAAAEPFGEQITGLTPDTEYVVRLDSAQADESNANGSVVTFRTPPVPVPAPPATPGAGGPPVPAITPGPGPVTGTPVPSAVARRCVVPKLKGLTYGGAKKRLARANCRLGRVKGRKLGTARVSAQTLKAGRRVKAGTKVGLTLKQRRVKRRR